MQKALPRTTSVRHLLHDAGMSRDTGCGSAKSGGHLLAAKACGGAAWGTVGDDGKPFSEKVVHTET